MASKLHANEISEILNKAIAMQVKDGVTGLTYNRTEKAKVINIQKRDLGKYMVDNGTAKYEAYSDNHRFNLDDLVYVNIPNNDYAEQKTIIGQYSTDDTKSATYISPLENYLPVSDSLFSDPDISTGWQPSAGILANGDNADVITDNYTSVVHQEVLLDTDLTPEKLLEKKGIPSDIQSNKDYKTDAERKKAALAKYKLVVEKALDKYNGYTAVGLSADFMTMLKALDAVKGNYGLLFIVDYYSTGEATDTNPNKEGTLAYRLDSSNMIGDIYNFHTYYQQEALFDLTSIPSNAKFTRFRIIFYQLGNFENSSKKEIAHSEKNKLTNVYENFPNNLLVRNIDFTFGEAFDGSAADDYAKVYTTSGTTYNSSASTAQNRKHLKFRWAHKVDNTDNSQAMIGVDSNTDITIKHKELLAKLNPKIHWYRYTLRKMGGKYAAQTAYYYQNGQKEDLWQGEESEVTGSALGGANWKEITPKVAGEYDYRRFEIDVDPITSRSSNYYKAIIEFGPEVTTTVDGKQVTGYDKASADYRFIVSNILELTTESEVVDGATADLLGSVNIKAMDPTKGKYYLYNTITNKLSSETYATTRHYLEVFMTSSEDGSNLLDNTVDLIWKIPQAMTMIQEIIPSNVSGGKILQPTDKIFNQIPYENGYIYIMRDASSERGSASNQQDFRIADYYSPNATSNTIYCYAIKNNVVYRGMITLEFGQQGSNGTDYTMTLRLGDKFDKNFANQEAGDSALLIGDSKYTEIKFELYDSKMIPVDLTSDKISNIIKLWTDRSSEGYFSGVNSAKNLDFIVSSDKKRVAVRVNPSVKDINALKYIILQASLKSTVGDDAGTDMTSVAFTAYLPIHIKTNATQTLGYGTDSVVYNDSGANPSYYNDIYGIINKGDPTRISGVKFKIDYVSKYKESDTLGRNGEANFFPKFNADNKLIVPTMYLENMKGNIGVNAILNDKVIYHIPLLIIKNRWNVPALNEWGGGLTVDPEGNMVLAAMVGAGHKNSDNTFTGVVMGDIKSVGKASIDTGLYGYESGDQSFGFNAEGTAFIGKAGTGRINFNGNEGTIQSAAWSTSDKGSNDPLHSGMRIDLQHGEIELNSVGDAEPTKTANTLKYVDQTNPSAHILLNTRERKENGQEKPYFKIDIATDTTSARKPLINIGSKDYYLQSADYTNTSGAKGLKIDLANGTLDSKSKLTINGAIGSEINFGDSVSYVKLGIDNAKGSYLQMERKKEASAAEKSAITSQMDSLYNKLPSGHTATKYSYPESNYKSDISRLETKYNQDYSNYQNSAEYQNAITEYSNAKADQADLDSAYNAALAKYNNLYAQYNGSSTGIDPDEALAEWNEAKTELASAQKAYEDKNNEVAQLQSSVSEKNLAVEEASTARDNVQSTVDAANSALEQSHNAFITELTQYAVLLYGLTETTDRVFPEYGNATIHQEKSETVVNPSKDDDAIAAQKQKTDDAYSAYQQAQTDYSDALTALEQANSNLNKAQQDATEAANEYATASEELKTYKTRLDDAVAAEDKAKLVYQSSVSNQGAHDQLSSDVANAKAALDVASANKQRGEARVNTATTNYNNVQNKLYGYTDSYNKGKEALSKYYDLAAKYLAITTNGGAGYIKLSNQDDIRLNIDNKFTVDKAGNLNARDANLTNATIEGTITSYRGIIGGWNISDHGLYQGDAGINAGVGSDSGNYYALWAGETNGAHGQAYTNAKFKVGHNGYLHAEGAYINGEIHATSGEFTGTIHATSGDFTGTISGSTIRGSTISGNSIYGGSISGASISGGNIYGTTISGAVISGNSISGGSIYGASISGGSISGTSISGASISGGTLSIDSFKFYLDGDPLYLRTMSYLSPVELQNITAKTPSGGEISFYAFLSKTGRSSRYLGAY